MVIGIHAYYGVGQLFTFGTALRPSQSLKRYGRYPRSGPFANQAFSGDDGWFAADDSSAKMAGMQYDPNHLESRATKLKEAGRERDAMAIYLYMADRDPSLDAGYLAMRVGECCERLGDLQSARWWYGRAVEENPSVDLYVEARQRLEHVGIEAIMDDETSV